MIVKIFLKPLTQKNCRKNDQTMSIDAEVTTASLMKRKTDAHNKMNGKRPKKTTGETHERPARSVCRALIPLDTAKIRKEYLKQY